MRLIEAYGILHNAFLDRDSLTVFLACGFNPLHLRTMLAAQLPAPLSGEEADHPLWNV